MLGGRRSGGHVAGEHHDAKRKQEVSCYAAGKVLHPHIHLWGERQLMSSNLAHHSPKATLLLVPPVLRKL